LTVAIASAAMAAAGDDHRLALPAAPVEVLATPTEPPVLAVAVDPWSKRAQSAAAFASGIAVRARAVFADQGLDEQGRRKALRMLVADVFDTKALGKALLGANSGRLSAKQLAAYQDVVADYIVPLYASKIYHVCDASPEIVSVDEGAAAVSVRTAYTAAPNDPPVMVDWRLDPRTDGSWRVLDISVNGISLAQGKMDEFDAVLRMQGPDAFLESLHNRAGEHLPRPMALAVEPPDTPPPAKPRYPM
jgi:phospholipid transport system substrate-binding protein